MSKIIIIIIAYNVLHQGERNFFQCHSFCWFTLLFFFVVVFGLHVIYFVTCNCDEDYNNGSINTFVFKHAVKIKIAYIHVPVGLNASCHWRSTGYVSQMGFGGLVREGKYGHYRYPRKKEGFLTWLNTCHCRMNAYKGTSAMAHCRCKTFP